MTNTLEEKIAMITNYAGSFENQIIRGDLIYCLQWLNSSLAVIKELEEELKERKAFIVANPCEQCGGKINAIKCEAWAKKVQELEGKLEIAKKALARLDDECLGERIDNIVLNAIKELNKQGEANDK
jgi:hypothetical protein